MTITPRTVIVLIFLALGGVVVGFGSVRHPYGEVIGKGPVLPPQPTIVETAARFRVASFNIHGGRGADGRRDLARTAKAIEGADLAGLNEVRGLSAFGGHNQAADLAARLGMAAVFGPSERRWYVMSFGNGLVSRFTILSWLSRPMRAIRAGNYRAVILAKIGIAGRTLEVIVAHVEHGEMRDAQLRELGSLFAGVQPPALMVGDFNADLSHPELRRITSVPGVVEAVSVSPTRGGFSGRVDHIYAKGFVVQAAQVSQALASDHPVVWADLELSLKTGPELSRSNISDTFTRELSPRQTWPVTSHDTK